MDALKPSIHEFLFPWLQTDNNSHFGLAVLVFAIYYSAVCILWIRKANGEGSLPTLRSISGLDALDEAIGRATEMGRPVLFNMAGGGSSGMAAQAILGYTATRTARYDTRMMTVTRNERMIPMAESTLREAYTAADKPDSPTIKDVRFLSSDQFTFATGVVGLLHREQCAAHLIFGDYYAESLILAEGGCDIGAIQVAGTTNNIQTPFFIACCDYTLLAEEIYVASAYLTKDRTRIATIVTQEYGKIFFFVLIVLGTLLNTFGISIIEDLLTLY